MGCELMSKTELPARQVVLVCDLGPGGLLHPVTRYDLREDGVMRITHGRAKAPLGLTVLQEAAALCLAVCQELSPARLPEAAVPAGRTEDVSPVEGTAETCAPEAREMGDGRSEMEGGAA